MSKARIGGVPGEPGVRHQKVLNRGPDQQLWCLHHPAGLPAWGPAVLSSLHFSTTTVGGQKWYCRSQSNINQIIRISIKLGPGSSGMHDFVIEWTVLNPCLCSPTSATSLIHTCHKLDTCKTCRACKLQPPPAAIWADQMQCYTKAWGARIILLKWAPKGLDFSAHLPKKLAIAAFDKGSPASETRMQM